MSTALPPKPRIVGASRARICIVASKYNEQFTDALVENALSELNEFIPQAKIDVVRVPGAYEIPCVVASMLAQEQAPSVMIALGLILRGGTAHGDLIAAAVTEQLLALSVKHQVPVINEVLIVEDDKQAYSRCIGANLNRGKEAARSAVAMLEIFAELEKSHLISARAPQRKTLR